MSNTKQKPIWTKSFIGISMTQFMVFMIFYTLLTTLPIYVINNLDGSESDGGLVVTVMLVAAIIVRPFSAKLLDKIGKKKGLIASVTTFTVTTFFYIWIDQFIPLLMLRFFHGLSFGVITTATGAIAADVIPPERRGAGLGYFAMAMNLAVVAGPFVGLSLLQFVSFQTLFVILSFLMIGGVIFSVIVHVPQVETTHRSIKRKFSIDDLIELKAIPIGLISSLVGLAYASILSFISVYSESLGLSAAASYFFLIFAIVMLLTRPYFGKTYDIKGPNYVILPCLIIFAIGLVSLSLTNSAIMLLISAGLIGLGYGTLLPSFQTMAIQTTEPSRSGHATATFFIFYDSGIAIGSFVWGIVVAGFGYQNLYIFCAILVLLIVGLFTLYQSRKPKQKQVNYTEVNDIN